MSDKQPWYILAGGGVVIGLLLGLIIGSSGGDDDDLEDRLKALEASVSEKIDTAKSDTTTAISGVSEKHTLLSDSVAEVKGAMADLKDDLSRVESSIGDRLSSLESQNAVLGEGQAAVGAQIAGIVDQLGTGLAVSADKLKAGFKSAMAEFHAERHGDAGDGSGGDTDTTTAAAVGASEPAAADDSPAAKLADKIGADGLILKAGETGKIGDGKLFISRVSEDGVNAMVVGGDKVDLSPYGDEVAVGGCEAILEGVADRSAYFRLDCSS
ncbi:MAG: hypothetical protein AAGD47_08960 [Pseudomonadota bacterium]